MLSKLFGTDSKEELVYLHNLFEMVVLFTNTQKLVPIDKKWAKATAQRLLDLRKISDWELTIWFTTDKAIQVSVNTLLCTHSSETQQAASRKRQTNERPLFSNAQFSTWKETSTSICRVYSFLHLFTS